MSFAMVNESGNVYLFSMDCDIKQGLIPKHLFENEKFVQIACGGVHVLYLTENNKLFGTGGEYNAISYSSGYGSSKKNVNGQPEEVKSCPFFTKVKDNVKRIIAGYFFAAIKTLNGEYYIFGYNNNNQFGEIDGILMAGNKIYGTNTQLTSFNIHDIEQLECGGYHSIIVSSK